MKVVILTQPLRTNFGGILQNYALQEVLRKLGHEPITVDYACRYPKWRWMIGRAKSWIFGTEHHIQYPHFSRSGQENLNKFIHNNINMTKPVDALTNTIIKHIQPDAIIVGSDQVWSPWANVPISFLGNMFLDFIPGFMGKRIAYAASFGGGEWTYSDELTEKCAELVKKFDAVSVREDSGAKLCKEHLGVDAVNVLDPTLLLMASEYERIINRPNHPTKTLFAYVLDTSEAKTKFFQSVADKYGLALKIQGANDDISWDDSIEGWLADIRDSEMVITDSFHGSVFAILFHKPFLSIVNYRRGGERFTSLLDMLELNNRIVSPDMDVSAISMDINWDKVDILLGAQRDKSIKFLKESL